MGKPSLRLDFRHLGFDSFFRFMTVSALCSMCLIGWFRLYKRTGLFLYIFFVLLFSCFDECDVASEPEKYN